MNEYPELLLILLSWDEKSGPLFLESSPALNPREGMKLGIQIYMIASSIFGTDDYRKENVDIPIPNLGFRARIWIDFRVDSSIRGGKLPIMLVATYSKPKFKIILSESDDTFAKALTSYSYENKIDLEFLRNYLQNLELLHFSNLDEFYLIISSLASSSYFGLTAGTILRAPIVHSIDLDKYFSCLPSIIPQGIVSQKLIDEIQEFWYVYWIGPFSFMFQPPIIDLDIFTQFINGISMLIEKLWNLTTTDPTSKLDIVNILTRIVFKPEIIFKIYRQSLEAASQKLSGKELSVVDRFRNSDVLFYIRTQVQRLLKNHFDSTKIPQVLSSFQKYIDGSYWEGFLIVYGFFLGEELFPNFQVGKKLNKTIVFEKIIHTIYLNNSKWKFLGEQKFEIINCPFCNFSNKCNFVRGIVLSVFESDILEIKKSESSKIIWLNDLSTR